MYDVKNEKIRITTNADDKDSIRICDWIWENVHSSHIRFCSYGDS